MKLVPTAAAFLSLLLLSGPVCRAQAFPPRGPVAQTMEEALNRMQPIKGQPAKAGVKAEIKGKVVAGYQGWFGAEGDSSDLGWKHFGGKNLGPGKCSFDLWPDLSEFDADEKYPTKFLNADGSVAPLFSSYNAKTVDRHFKWMKDYGLDGVMLQRFGGSTRSPQGLDFGTGVMQNVRNAAAHYDRNWAMMYDLSGMQSSDMVAVISDDWKHLVDRAKILKDKGYLHHNGKPLVAVWGVGFSDGRKYGLKECAELVEFLQHDPVYGGNAVMLGVPYYWLEQKQDTVTDPELHELLKKADIISPWAVGRYKGSAQVAKNLPARLTADIAWCNENKRSYLPVIFPGFSWQNLQKGRGKPQELNAIDREGGQFLWQQALEAKRAGAEMIYVAMFDEIDEGTAIMKGSNTPPVGDSNFMTYNGLPPDQYLWLTGEITKMLRGKAPKDDTLPKR
jgi:hypothetical protein